MKGTWLSDNIRSIQSLIWSFAAIVIIFIIVTKSSAAEEKILYLILGNLFGLCMNQQGYYFTASKPQNVDPNLTTTSSEIKITKKETQDEKTDSN